MNGEDDHLGPLLLRRITVTGGGGIRPSPSSHSSSSSSSASAIIRTPLEDDPINNDNLFWYDASALFANRSVCLGLTDILIALALIVLILATVLGNVLVVLSVFMYKRMRTFNNFLLTSLATADLLVGLLIMPLSLLDLLHRHNWPFGRVLCRIWATSDVLLCTASIMNLVVISLDRYMAITSPLRYPRNRSRRLACGLLCFVWGMSLIVCSPPWFITEWSMTFDSNRHSQQPSPASAVGARIERGGNSGGSKTSASKSTTTTRHLVAASDFGDELLLDDDSYLCAYPTSVAYRIYSACCSFYIPLIIMLFVYWKIFRVANERERMIMAGGTCRLSRRAEKTHIRARKRSSATPHNRFILMCKSAPIDRNRVENQSIISRDPPAGRYCFSLHNKASPENIINFCRRTTATPVGVMPATLCRSENCSVYEEQDEEEDELMGAGGRAEEEEAGEGCHSNSSSPGFSRHNSSNRRKKSIGGGGGGGAGGRLSVSSARRASAQLLTTTTFGGAATKNNNNNGGGGGVEGSRSADCLRTALDPAATTTSTSIGSPEMTTTTHTTGRFPTAEGTPTGSRRQQNGPTSTTTVPNSNPNPNRETRERRLSACVNNVQIPRRALQPHPNPTSAAAGGDSSTTTTHQVHAAAASHSQDKHRLMTKQLSSVSTTCPASTTSAFSVGSVTVQNGGGGGQRFRGSKEKIVYLRERKALKTIGIVVMGFIICWMPFFIVYLLEVFVDKRFSVTYGFRIFSEFFLWLGYSNSVLNPIIYTMYNGDFRRCFRDLLGFGCCKHHRRTMSVKKLHQSTLF